MATGGREARGGFARDVGNSLFGHALAVNVQSQFNRISHTFVGRNEQTPTLPELRSRRNGHLREHGVSTENRVCAVPARPCDLVPAYCEKCGLTPNGLALPKSWRLRRQVSGGVCR